MDQLSEIIARLEALERLHHRSGVVRGWSAAARVLEVSVKTVKKLHRLGRLPPPLRVNGWKTGTNPEWRLSSLINYKTEK